MWGAFMQECAVLAERHPYVIKPSGKQVGSWALCFSIGERVKYASVHAEAVNEFSCVEMHCRQKAISHTGHHWCLLVHIVVPKRRSLVARPSTLTEAATQFGNRCASVIA